VKLIHLYVPVRVATDQEMDLGEVSRNNGKPTIPAKATAYLAVQRSASGARSGVTDAQGRDEGR
jgi:hypothetical protein